MLRPEQIANVKFTPISKGTYNAEEVDAFLKTVADSYDESLNQNKELIKKISILADKIESYRNDEEAIKLALLDAHKMSETINKNAKTKADDILTDAETRSKIILDGANRQADQTIIEAKEKAKQERLAKEKAAKLASAAELLTPRIYIFLALFIASALFENASREMLSLVCFIISMSVIKALSMKSSPPYLLAATSIL